MPFRLLYHPAVATDDLPRLDAKARARIRKAILSRLTSEPEKYGKPLRFTLAGLWSLRVGDWRVIYHVAGDEGWILKIGHRRDQYEQGRREREAFFQLVDRIRGRNKNARHEKIEQDIAAAKTI